MKAKPLLAFLLCLVLYPFALQAQRPDTLYSFAVDFNYYEEVGAISDQNDGIYRNSGAQLLKYSTKTGAAVANVAVGWHRGNKEVYGMAQRRFQQLEKEKPFYPDSLFSALKDDRNSLQIVNEFVVGSKFHDRQIDHYFLIGVNVYTGKSLMFYKIQYDDWKYYEDWDADVFVDLADGVHPISISMAKQTGEFTPYLACLAVNTGSGLSKVLQGSMIGPKTRRMWDVNYGFSLKYRTDAYSAYTSEQPIKNYNFDIDGPVEAKMLYYRNVRKTDNGEKTTLRMGIVYCTKKTGKTAYWQRLGTNGDFKLVKQDTIPYTGDIPIQDWEIAAADEQSKYVSDKGVFVIFYSPSKKMAVREVALTKRQKNVGSIIYNDPNRRESFQFDGNMFLFNFAFNLVDGESYHGILIVDHRSPNSVIRLFRGENSEISNGNFLPAFKTNGKWHVNMSLN